MEGFHVITCESEDSIITVPIPESCKPLSASVQALGGTTGILASFYDPEAHTWVVKHAPVDIGFVRVTVKVLTLEDAQNHYEVYIAATSAESGAGVDEIYELKRRSFAYKTAREVRPDEGPGGAPRAWPPAGVERPKFPRDLVTLCAPLPVLGGYVLCGGGFTSDYPVYETGPAMPIVTDRFYDRVMGSDAAFFAAVAAQREANTGDGSGSCLDKTDRAGNGVVDPFAVYNMLKPDESDPVMRQALRDGDERLEFSAWSVTCVPNAGLGCFAIGLRSRDVRTTAPVVRDFVLDNLEQDDVNFAPRTLHLESPSRLESTKGQGKPVTAPRHADADVRTPPRRGTLRSPSAHVTLLSPSRFSSPDSEALSSPDSEYPSPEKRELPGRQYSKGEKKNYPLSKTGEDTGMVVSGSSGSFSLDAPSPSDHRDRVQSAIVPAGNTNHTEVGMSRAMFTADEVTRELQTRKNLVRMVALRKLMAVTHRPQSHVVDVVLPPPYGKIRARYGLGKETRDLAQLFYR